MNKVEQQIERLETKAELHGLRGEDAELFHHELEVAQSLRLLNDVANAAELFLYSESKSGQFEPEHQWSLEEALAAWKEHSDES